VAGDAWSKELDGSKDLIGDWVGKKCGNFNTKTNKCLVRVADPKLVKNSEEGGGRRRLLYLLPGWSSGD